VIVIAARYKSTSINADVVDDARTRVQETKGGVTLKPAVSSLIRARPKRGVPELKDDRVVGPPFGPYIVYLGLLVAFITLVYI
jgi:hypothetical protein